MSGTHENTRTGTTGTYSASRSYNPYTGQEKASTQRSFDTAGGTTGNVSRHASYNWQTGQGSYGSSMSAQGPGGGSVDGITGDRGFQYRRNLPSAPLFVGQVASPLCSRICAVTSGGVLSETICSRPRGGRQEKLRPVVER